MGYAKRSSKVPCLFSSAKDRMVRIGVKRSSKTVTFARNRLKIPSVRFKPLISRAGFAAALKETRLKLIASGGISSLDDIHKLKELDIFLNKSVKKIGEDIKAHKFNTGVSELMKLVNKFEEFRNQGYLIPNTKYVILLKLLSPYAPHIAEELWEKLGNTASIFKAAWPSWDEECIKEDIVTVVIQINGKVKDRLNVPVGTSKEVTEKLAIESPKIKAVVDGQNIKKIIVVPEKLVNIVL